MTWNGNECGENYGSENLKGTIPSTDYGRSETIGKSSIFQIFGWHDK